MTKHPADNPFSAGDTVTVTIHDWEEGEQRLTGRVVHILSPARCQVEIGDRRYSVLIEDMELGCADTLSQARAA